MADKQPAFRVVTWNIGGAKFLELPPEPTAKQRHTRDAYRRGLHRALAGLTEAFEPDVVLLQEIVRFGSPPEDLIEVEKLPGYYYAPCIAIDTINQPHPLKWNKYYEGDGKWEKGCYLAQGYGLLWRRDLQHAPIWDFTGHAGPDLAREIVHIETGLFTGSRDTEPRLALVAHFIVDVPAGPDQTQPLDIFTVNLHLTTLKGEREGSPSRDMAAATVRRQQVELIANGIVSRYNEWAKEKRADLQRPPAIWVLGGDFNCMPGAPEIEALERMNFIDLNPAKASGTKGTAVPIKEATITLDYLFAGPAYFSIDPYLAKKAAGANPTPLEQYKVSDHFPILAKVPLGTGR